MIIALHHQCPWSRVSTISPDLGRLHSQFYSSCGCNFSANPTSQSYYQPHQPRGPNNSTVVVSPLRPGY